MKDNPANFVRLRVSLLEHRTYTLDLLISVYATDCYLALVFLETLDRLMKFVLGFTLV